MANIGGPQPSTENEIKMAASTSTQRCFQWRNLLVRSSSDFVARGRQRQRESETKRVSFTCTEPVLSIDVYRPPSSNAVTDISLAACIENVVAQNKECFD